jgi:hypothetical protein
MLGPQIVADSTPGAACAAWTKVSAKCSRASAG